MDEYQDRQTEKEKEKELEKERQKADNRRVAERIDLIRRRNGMSMQVLGEKIKMSQPTISRMLSGHQTISFWRLRQISEVLGVHPFSLLTDQPLDRSTLLPKSDAPQLLSLSLAIARDRAKLDTSVAARALDVSVGELIAIEHSLSTPNEDFLERAAVLYHQSVNTFHAIASLDRNAPDLSVFLATALKNAAFLGQLVLDEARAEGLSPERRAGLRAIAERCLEYLGGQMSGEPPPIYYVLGHVSKTLLAALQDVDFHSRMEELAKEWEAGQKVKSSTRPASATHAKVVAALAGPVNMQHTKDFGIKEPIAYVFPADEAPDEVNAESNTLYDENIDTMQ